jgi:DNA-binding Lrp family transcriptional regulator
MTAGGFDYLLKIRARSMADFRRFLGSRLLMLPGLQRPAMVVRRQLTGPG